MDKFLNTTEGFDTTLKLIETINHTTDDYLFIWDIGADTRWFFGDIDKHYDIRKNGSETNSTLDMLKIIYPADRDEVLNSLKDIAEGKKDVHNMNYRWINRQGEKVWINCNGNVIRDKDNKPYIMIGRVSEEKLRHLYNPLTALWNKNKLRADLKKRIEEKNGYFMLLDIDSLATINLKHGRKYGDMLLKEIAELCENIECVENAYHIDHNYFALVLNLSSENDVRGVYEFIKHTMAEKCTFTASVVPIDNTLFYDETQLIDSVNMTLRKAKDISINRIEFFSTEDLSSKIASLELLEELKLSVENNFEGFEVYYQPQIRSGSYDIYGVEALLRFTSKTRGMVFPDEFIPLLEQSRLIKPVGMWVFREALSQCKKWREFLPELHVSVNLSVLQFEDANLAEKIVDILNKIGLNGDALTVEITESIEISKSSAIINTIKVLKQYDISFAIDDFGTGYSNLGYLKQIDVDEIKIDKIFVTDIDRETYNHKLISNVIEFAKGNGIRTCCEGVESARELVTLELLYPDIVQGYLFDKPVTAEHIEKTYLNFHTSEYKDRCEFINKIQKLKEKMGVVHFSPKEILRENGVGLWLIRMNSTQDHYELHIDETLEKLLAIDLRFSSSERFDYFISKIHPDYLNKVKACLNEMMEGLGPVQVEFVWQHPDGNVCVRCSGKKVVNSNGTTVVEGYYRHIPKVQDR